MAALFPLRQASFTSHPARHSMLYCLNGSDMNDVHSLASPFSVASSVRWNMLSTTCVWSITSVNRSPQRRKYASVPRVSPDSAATSRFTASQIIVKASSSPFWERYPRASSSLPMAVCRARSYVPRVMFVSK